MNETQEWGPGKIIIPSKCCTQKNPVKVPLFPPKIPFNDRGSILGFCAGTETWTGLVSIWQCSQKEDLYNVPLLTL